MTSAISAVVAKFFARQNSCFKTISLYIICESISRAQNRAASFQFCQVNGILSANEKVMLYVLIIKRNCGSLIEWSLITILSSPIKKMRHK